MRCAAYSRSLAVLARGTRRGFAQRLCQLDRALGRAIFDEDQLGRMAQVDLTAEFATQESACVFERIERLPRLVTIADHRDEDLAVAQVVADLRARHRHER